MYLGGTAGGRTGSQAFLAAAQGPAVPADQVPELLEGVLRNYLAARENPGESFGAFCRRVGAAAIPVEAIGT